MRRHPLSPDDACQTLVVELVGALDDLDGLDRLDVDRLGSLSLAVDIYPGGLGTFRSRARAAWEMSRPPTADDLTDADRWDSGLIDWGDEAAEALAVIDAGDLDDWEDWGDIDDDDGDDDRLDYWRRMKAARAELAGLDGDGDDDGPAGPAVVAA